MNAPLSVHTGGTEVPVPANFLWPGGKRIGVIFRIAFEAWSDDQWIQWLSATRSDVEVAQPWRGSFRGGGLGMSALGAGMLGLQQAIFGPLDEPDVVLVVDADGHDDDDAVTIDVQSLLRE